MQTANRSRRVMVSVTALALTSYVVLFYAMRFGVRASNFPRIYIFSSDPVRNQLGHRFFTPMIMITGGVSAVPADAGDSKDANTETDNRSVYLIGNEPLFGRIADHYNAFLDLPDQERKEESETAN